MYKSCYCCVMKTTKTLTLYKRHTEDCEVHKTRVQPEKRKFWFDCNCMVWLTGRLPDGRPVPRESTGCRDVKAAEAYRADFLAANVRKAVVAAAPTGITIGEAIERYQASRTHEIYFEAGQHIKLALGRLKKYCDAQGVFYMKELTADLVERFKEDGLASFSDVVKGTTTSKIRTFLRHAYRRDWTADALALKVLPHATLHQEAEPYTVQEVEALLTGSVNVGDVARSGYSKHPHTFRLLLELMLDTGMRCGDAVRYDPAVAFRSGLWVYSYVPQKQQRKRAKKTVEVFISEKLKTAIDQSTWFSAELPFIYGAGRCTKTYHARQVYRRMKNVLGPHCGIEDCRPHRLRDTFAVNMLLRDVSLDDLSRLLGHSSVKTTEMYYAKWVTSRKQRLENVVAQALLLPAHGTLGNSHGVVAPLA